MSDDRIAGRPGLSDQAPPDDAPVTFRDLRLAMEDAITYSQELVLWTASELTAASTGKNADKADAQRARLTDLARRIEAYYRLDELR